MESVKGMKNKILSALLIVIVYFGFSFTVFASTSSEDFETDPSLADDVIEEVVPELPEASVMESKKKGKEGEDTDFAMEAAASTSSITGSGGAAEDVGESSISTISVPEPSVFTGSVSTKIPLIAPPGRGGIAPNLALNYSSSSKNGWIGVGWSLGMGSIQRSAKNGMDCDGNDYVASASGGTSELIAVNIDGEGYGEYSAKIESSFSKYTKLNNNSWELKSKDGSTCRYGQRPNSRQNCESGIYKWLLDEVEDANGNTMSIDYYHDADTGQIYLKRINYTGHVNGQLPGNYVEFHLADRVDPILSYESHQEVVTAKILKVIEMGNVENEVDKAFRAYVLTYTQSGSSRSLLTNVMQYGPNDTNR